MSVNGANTQLNNVLNAAMQAATGSNGSANEVAIVNALEAGLNASPVLLAEYNTNAQSGQLQAINFVQGSQTIDAQAQQGANGLPVETTGNLIVSDINFGLNYAIPQQENGGVNYGLIDLAAHENYHVGYANQIYDEVSNESSGSSSIAEQMQQYFSTPSSLRDPSALDGLIQQGVNFNDQNEAGAIITGFNAAASAYMQANSLTSMTSSDVSKLAEIDPYVELLFNGDTGAPLYSQISLNQDGTINLSQTVQNGLASVVGTFATSGGMPVWQDSPDSSMPIQASGNTNDTYYGAEMVADACMANGNNASTPITLNYAQDGLLEGSSTASPSSIALADQFFAANAGSYFSSLSAQTGSPSSQCTIIDSVTGTVSNFSLMAPGTTFNGTLNPSIFVNTESSRLLRNPPHRRQS
ncbi:hypothetical protein [Rhodanobacter sp. DHB23]|uniref:hypothetical protein n=1 Tax=Rhodanobacter sp. DHB23 TaxID=2775923 RepID=UPI001780756A|nr:hypothetical protein [Rhodanobacter sp. DHB23]MBD8873500.1 hypothetical protein [Rhodanobacter sp. DHB23]